MENEDGGWRVMMKDNTRLKCIGKERCDCKAWKCYCTRKGDAVAVFFLVQKWITYSHHMLLLHIVLL